MDPDPAAPVYETADIDVAAPAEAVWDSLTDVESWPRWMPGVKSVVTHGPFSVGSKFEWRAGPGVIRSEVMDAARPRLAAWKGRTMGTRAVHAWRIDALGSDSSHVHTGESWRGPLPLLMRGMMGRAVRIALDAGVPALKAEAERRSRS